MRYEVCCDCEGTGLAPVFYIEGIPIQEDCGTCEGTGELNAGDEEDL